MYSVDRLEPEKQAIAHELLTDLVLQQKNCLLPWQVVGEFLNCMRRWESQERITAADVQDYIHDLLTMFPLVLPTVNVVTPEIRTYAVMKLATKRGHFRNGKCPLVLSHWVQTRRIGAKFSKQFSAAERRRQIAPGVSPGNVWSRSMSPGGATACEARMVMMLNVEQMRLLKMSDCRRPFGAFVTGYGDPRADARGYLPSPLRGGKK